MNSRRIPLLIALVGVAIVAAVYGAVHVSKQPKELNVLLWAGYEEPEILKPFEDRTGAKVNFKTFVGGDAMFAQFTVSKGIYDAVIVDPEYIAKLHALGRLKELDPALFGTEDYLETFRHFPLSWIDGKFYAPVVEFGANALVYNTDHITAEEASSYDILFNKKVQGRIGVWDWYLPIMGVLSRSLGNEQPYDLNAAQFDALKQRLYALRPSIRAIHASIPEVLAALASEDTWITPGGAGWAASALKQMAKPYDWVVPKEGGIMWVDTVVIPNDAPHPELAAEYVKWMMSAEAQAALSKKRAYHSNVPNRKAYPLMTREHAKSLRATTEEEMMEWVARLSMRALPVKQTEQEWQAAWETFKVGKN